MLKIFIFAYNRYKKWQNSYSCDYKNEKDAQCSEADFGVQERICAMFSSWDMVDFVFYLRNAFRT